jgi:hypothetical protein
MHKKATLRVYVPKLHSETIQMTLQQDPSLYMLEDAEARLHRRVSDPER